MDNGYGPATYLTYKCPTCGRPTSKMLPSETHTHQPTHRQLFFRPHLGPVAHEILICPCGETLNWFQMVEVWEHCN